MIRGKRSVRKIFFILFFFIGFSVLYVLRSQLPLLHAAVPSKFNGTLSPCATNPCALTPGQVLGSSGGVYQNISGDVHIISGNLGIGTTIPGASLDVVGAGTGSLRAGDAGCGNNYAGIWFNQLSQGCNNYNMMSSPSDPNLHINAPSGYGIYFKENNATRMYIKNNGNVEIGTRDTAYSLDVTGGMNADQVCIAGTCQSSWPTGTNYWTLSGSNLYPNSTSYKVGIGTTSPDSSSALTVAGATYAPTNSTFARGVYGSAGGPNTFGVYGFNTQNGYGVYGVTNSGGASSGGYGVGGANSNNSGYGVWGEDDSPSSYGVYGYASGGSGIGVGGYGNQYGGYFTGPNNGVYGNGITGVVATGQTGVSGGGTSAGVIGVANGPNAYGGEFTTLAVGSTSPALYAQAQSAAPAFQADGYSTFNGDVTINPRAAAVINGPEIINNITTINGPNDATVGVLQVARGARSDYIKLVGPGGGPYTSTIQVTHGGTSHNAIYIDNDTGNVSIGSNNTGVATLNVTGSLNVTGTITAGTKDFVIDHPTKNGYSLVHSSLEGPEAAVFYRGEGTLTNGTATITLPDYFEALTRTDGRTVQLTAKGTMPFMLSASDVANGSFQVYGSKADGSFYWEVKAVRKDIPPIQVEVKK